MLDGIRTFFSGFTSAQRAEQQMQDAMCPGPEKSGREAACGRGLLVFEHTGEVVRAEQILKNIGLSVEIKGPPPQLRTGCDMVIEFPLVEELAAIKALTAEKVTLLSIVPVSGELLEPVSLFRITDYGKWFMVRAANMKITVDKESGCIVNVSGGGCPDVPYLAASLVGKMLVGPEAAPEPKIIGHTLCGYALQLAYEEVKRQVL